MSLSPRFHNFCKLVAESEEAFLDLFISRPGIRLDFQVRRKQPLTHEKPLEVSPIAKLCQGPGPTFFLRLVWFMRWFGPIGTGIFSLGESLVFKLISPSNLRQLHVGRSSQPYFDMIL